VLKQCPGQLRDEIVRSFALYWCDERACANVIRSAIEWLLTLRSIPTNNDKGRRMALHDRIVEFRRTDDESGKFLLTLKIVGNVGSHGDVVEITEDDLLDAYEIFEYVLERIYANKSDRIAKLAADLEARLNPPKATAKRSAQR
jgi:hypothetical protein